MKQLKGRMADIIGQIVIAEMALEKISESAPMYLDNPLCAKVADLWVQAHDLRKCAEQVYMVLRDEKRKVAYATKRH